MLLHSDDMSIINIPYIRHRQRRVDAWDLFIQSTLPDHFLRVSWTGTAVWCPPTFWKKCLTTWRFSSASHRITRAGPRAKGYTPFHSTSPLSSIRYFPLSVSLLHLSSSLRAWFFSVCVSRPVAAVNLSLLFFFFSLSSSLFIYLSIYFYLFFIFFGSLKKRRKKKCRGNENVSVLCWKAVWKTEGEGMCVCYERLQCS